MTDIGRDVINIFPSIHKYEYTNTIRYEYVKLVLDEDITTEHAASIVNYISNKYPEIIMSLCYNIKPTKSIVISISK